MGFKSDLETVILGSLQAGALHGYEISKQISAKSEGLLKIGEGQLYPALHKLEAGGLVTSEWVSQEGRPARKVYAITSAGATALASKRAQWEQFANGIGAILTQPKEATNG